MIQRLFNLAFAHRHVLDSTLSKSHRWQKNVIWRTLAFLVSLDFIVLFTAWSFCCYHQSCASLRQKWKYVLVSRTHTHTHTHTTQHTHTTHTHHTHTVCWFSPYFCGKIVFAFLLKFLVGTRSTSGLILRLQTQLFRLFNFCMQIARSNVQFIYYLILIINHE